MPITIKERTLLFLTTPCPTCRGRGYVSQSGFEKFWTEIVFGGIQVKKCPNNCFCLDGFNYTVKLKLISKIKED